MQSEAIRSLDEYLPAVYGLEVPEALLREVYIMKPDLSPMIGWENGLESIPELMNLNLQALREAKAPSPCLYQWDETHPMNPLGLLMAYAEAQVRPAPRNNCHGRKTD